MKKYFDSFLKSPLSHDESIKSEKNDVENQQGLVDSRYNALIAQLNEQIKENEDQRKNIEELKKQQLHIQKELHQQNESSHQRKLIQDVKQFQTEYNQQQKNLVQHLAKRLGEKNAIALPESKINHVERQKLLSTDPLNAWSKTSEAESTQNAIVFDVPEFFCCILRFIYAIMSIVIIKLYWINGDFTALIYVLAFLLAFSIPFEAASARLKDVRNYWVFFLHILGGILFWITFAYIYDHSYETDLEEHKNELAFIPSVIGGIMMILAELILAIQLSRKSLPISLVFFHGFGALGIIFLLLSHYTDLTDFFFFDYLFMAVSSLQPIFLVFGLPQTNAQEMNKNGMNKKEIANDMDEHKTLEVKTSQFDDENSLTSNNVDSILYILHHLVERVELIESRQLKSSKNDFSNEETLERFDEFKKSSGLSEDVYTLMMFVGWRSKTFRNPLRCIKKDAPSIILPYPNQTWVIGFVTFMIQFGLSLFTLADQLDTDYGDTVLDIPIRVTKIVLIGQFVTLVLSFMSQTDILVSCRDLIFISYYKNTWQELIGFEKNERSFTIWAGRILIPNVLKSVQGLVVLITSYVIILQSDNNVDLLKDFTALFVISSIDDMVFFMADYGYLGQTLSIEASDAKEKVIEGNRKDSQWCLNILLFLIMFGMLIGWCVVVTLQNSGHFVRQEYPLCSVDDFGVNQAKIGDGVCHFQIGVAPNTADCGWEGGDCEVLITEAPNCTATDPSRLNNGICDGENNIIECSWDGGDCDQFNKELFERDPMLVNCTAVDTRLVGNGECDGDLYNTSVCRFDGGDCL